MSVVWDSNWNRENVCRSVTIIVVNDLYTLCCFSFHGVKNWTLFFWYIFYFLDIHSMNFGVKMSVISRYSLQRITWWDRYMEPPIEVKNHIPSIHRWNILRWRYASSLKTAKMYLYPTWPGCRMDCDHMGLADDIHRDLTDGPSIPNIWRDR